jgi:hypothetical protein
VGALRLLVVHARQVASQAAAAYAAVQAKEAAHGAEHRQRVEARWVAGVADAEAAMAAYEGRGQGRRGRKPRPWRSHALHYRVEAVTQRQKRPQRGRLPKPALPQATSRSGLRGEAAAHVPSADTQGGTGLATTVGAESGTEPALLPAYQAPHSTVAPGWRGSKNPAALSPGWREKPARMAA